MVGASSSYPFGLQQNGIGLTASSSLHDFKDTFRKQELNEDLGVDLYEFKYRVDDPEIGRFWQIDPWQINMSIILYMLLVRIILHTL